MEHRSDARGCQLGLVLRTRWQLLLASVGRLWNTFVMAVLCVASLSASIEAVLTADFLAAVPSAV